MKKIKELIIKILERIGIIHPDKLHKIETGNSVVNHTTYSKQCKDIVNIFDARLRSRLRLRGLNIILSDDKPYMVSLGFSKNPLSISSVTISPEAIEGVIKSNFTFIERIYYNNPYIIEAAIAYIDLFITGLLSHPNKADIFSLMYYLSDKDNTDHSMQQDAMNLLNKLMDDILYSDTYGNHINSDHYSFLHAYSMKSTQKVLSIFSKCIVSDLESILSPTYISTEVLSGIKNNNN